MQSTKQFVISCLVASSQLRTCNAFAASHQFNHIHHNSLDALASYNRGRPEFSADGSTILLAKNEAKDESKGMTSLNFIGEKVYKSQPVPIMHDDPTALSAFFAQHEFRCLLFNDGDGENKIELLPNDQIDEGLIDLWTKQCDIVGGERPEPGDAVFMVETGGINFTNLKVKSNSFIGVKYMKDPSSQKPEYQLVFIKDTRIVEGPRLLVWIFNTLTGKNKKQSDNDVNEQQEEQSVRAFSRFSYEDDQDGESLMFVVKSKLEVIVKFPSLLLKVLPVTKEKAEEQGSASVLKAMGKDIEAVLPKVRDFYCKKFDGTKV